MTDKVLITAPGVLTDRERALAGLLGVEVVERRSCKPGDMYVIDPDTYRQRGPDGVWRTFRELSETSKP